MMISLRCRCTPVLYSTLAAILIVSAPGSGPAAAQTITQIIDGTNGLNHPVEIAVDADGNAYVACLDSDNVFKITPDGLITEIMDSTGEQGGNEELSAQAVNHPILWFMSPRQRDGEGDA